MKKSKKDGVIAALERKLNISEAGQIHRHHFADANLHRVVTDKMQGSGVILSMKFLSGDDVFDPVLIYNGLSKETVEAIKADLRRSFAHATELAPAGVTAKKPEDAKTAT